MRIGVAQIANTLNRSLNLDTLWRALRYFEDHPVDLVLFPECALTGFSAHLLPVLDNERDALFNPISHWCRQNDSTVVLPMAFERGSRLYNGGVIVSPFERREYTKQGLTPSECHFFSPGPSHNRQFTVQGRTCGLLICKEAQEAPGRYIDASQCDLILWPAYWGWTPQDHWGQPDCLVYQNMQSWRTPLVQANFAFNEGHDMRQSGPQGMSVVVNQSGQLSATGLHHTEDFFRVKLKGLEK